MDEKLKEKIIKLITLKYKAKAENGLLGENVKELRALKKELRNLSK